MLSLFPTDRISSFTKSGESLLNAVCKEWARGSYPKNFQASRAPSSFPVELADRISSFTKSGEGLLHIVCKEWARGSYDKNLEASRVLSSFPVELLESTFDFLDDGEYLECAVVARRWHGASLPQVLCWILTPILWAIPSHTVQEVYKNLGNDDLMKVSCVCTEWRRLNRE
uniref:F-box domain-containing protein n=1 Tax=Octactis speculum TaxID=3111310 RepID=A0A7S2HKW0_9STRA|mmetsp:Transcript_7205/g.8896  ORF Transcript_7205/g.8896 Transcript_7205/m.8896 type:complete len:171 (+) Transcript_7205:3-515(+)